MRKDTENFLFSSEYDLTTAQHMLKTGRYIYVVFMCHIAIEKLLKAIVAEITNKTPPKTHNLLYLVKLANLFIPQELFDFIAKINNSSVVTRYPEDFKKMNIRKRLEILGLAAGRVFEPIEAIGYTAEEIRDIKGTFLEEVLQGEEGRKGSKKGGNS